MAEHRLAGVDNVNCEVEDFENSSQHSLSCPNHPDNTDGKLEYRVEQEIEGYFEGPGIDVPIQKVQSWKDCFDITSVEEPYRDMVVDLLESFPQAYARHQLDLGEIKDNDLKLTIEVTDLPQKSKIYPIPPPLVEPTREIINELVELGVLAPSFGPCQSSCFLVPKNTKERIKMDEAKERGDFDPKDFKFRFIVDFRPLNRVIIEKFSGSSSITHVYSVLARKECVTLLDVKSCFYQLVLHESCRHLCQIGLDSGLGSWCFVRCPMGLSLSPAALQYSMHKILNPRRPTPDGKGYEITPIHPENITYYMDDLLIACNNAEEMNKCLRDLFARLEEVGFKLSISKAEFFCVNKKVELLGELCDKDGRSIVDKKCELSEKMIRPKTVKELQRVLGFYNFLSSHIPGYQGIVACMTDKLSASRGPISWNAEMEEAFQKLKRMVAENHKLYHLNYDHPLFLQTDASDVAAGCCLLQYINDEVRVVNFHSMKFPRNIRDKYSIVCKEALSIIMGIAKFRQQLEAVRLRGIITDAKCIGYILSGARSGNSRLARLALTLLSTPFKLIIKHRSGEDNVIPDALSRFFAVHRPHLKLNNVYDIKRDDIVLPHFEEGEITTLEQINAYVNSDNDCIRPFLKNESDVSKVGELQLVQEIHTFENDLDQVLSFDNTVEGTITRNLLQPVIDEPLHKIEGISLASREVTWEALIKAQRSDSSCLQQIRKADMGHESASQFRIENGMLVRKRYPDKGWKHPGNSLIVVPGNNSELITYIISSLHFGHHGYKKILTTIRRIFYIPKIKKHVMEFTKGCHICSILRLHSRKRDPANHLYVPKHPMEIIDIDFFYLDKTGRYQYVLNIVDRYSHKTFAVACTRMTAGVVVKALEGVFSNHSPPMFVCGDNQVSLLRNAEVMNFCTKWGTRIKTGLPYSSRSQSIIETHNGALKYLLKALMIQHSNNHWPDLLPLAVYLANTTPNTGLPSPLCPDQVHFGREIMIFPVMKHKISGHVLPEEYYEQTKLYTDANKRAIAAYHKWKFKHPPRDSQLRGTPFAPGNFCYFRRLVPGQIKPGTGEKYVNTVYKIERVYHSLVFLRDVYKVTAPPYTVTTTVHFLKPFSPRNPFLFKNIKPDQAKIGAPLVAKDIPSGDRDENIPEVYDPNPPKKEKGEPKLDPKPPESSLEISEGEDPSSEEEDDDNLNDSKPSSPSPNNVGKNTSLFHEETLDHNSKLTDEAQPKAEKSSKTFTSWIKEALQLPGRQTRSGKKLDN